MRNNSLLLAILLSLAFAGCAQASHHIMPVDDSVQETIQNFNDMAIIYDLTLPFDKPKQLSVWMDTYEDGKHVERLVFYENHDPFTSSDHDFDFIGRLHLSFNRLDTAESDYLWQFYFQPESTNDKTTLHNRGIMTEDPTPGSGVATLNLPGQNVTVGEPVMLAYFLSGDQLDEDLSSYTPENLINSRRLVRIIFLLIEDYSE